MKAWKMTLSLMIAMVLLMSMSALATEVPAPEFAESTDAAPATEPEIEYNDKGMPRIPDFTLPGEDGSELTLSDLRGKKVVMNFWASWCPPCQQEMPDFQRYFTEMVEGGEDYALLSINLADGVQETRENSVKFMQDNGYTFPVHYDETGMVFMMFSDGSIPVTVVMDEEGFLMNGAIGMINHDALMQMLEGSR